MASVAATLGLGTSSEGDGMSAAAPSASCSSTTCTSSTLTLIALNDMCISDLWEHQKKDFIQCNGDNSSCITDEVFAFHLLKIHASFCIDKPGTLCKCQCSSSTTTRQSNLNLDVESQPNCTQSPLESTASSNMDMLLNPDASKVEIPGLKSVKMEPPDQESEETYLNVSLEFKQEEDDMAGEDGFYHFDGEKDFWLNYDLSANKGTEDAFPKLKTAKITLQKLDIRRLSSLRDHEDTRSNYSGNADHNAGQDHLTKVREEQALQDDATGTSRSRIQPSIHIGKQNEDHLEMKNDEMDEDGGGVPVDSSSAQSDAKHAKARPFSCHVCQKTFYTKGNLKYHAITHTGYKPFTCTVCSWAFYQRSTLKHHMITHTGKRPFTCSMCGKIFPQKSDLIAHMMAPTGDACSDGDHTSFLMKKSENKKTFSCHVCQKTFTLKGALKKHAIIHTGNRPFSCHVCQRTFTLKGALKKHAIIHTGNRPFSCHVCQKTFYTKGNLKYHAITHTGYKPFTCTVCSWAFYQRSTLKRHMITHTGKRPFTCSMCGKIFPQICDLIAHMMARTGDACSDGDHASFLIKKSENVSKDFHPERCTEAACNHSYW